MKCKDCVHYEVCKEQDAMLGENKIDEIVGVENHCELFKPKSRFVEVVRCKDCKSFKHIQTDDVDCHICNTYGGFVTETDYCSRYKKALKEREKE